MVLVHSELMLQVVTSQIPAVVVPQAAFRGHPLVPSQGVHSPLTQETAAPQVAMIVAMVLLAVASQTLLLQTAVELVSQVW
jgi:hypothetical protein